MNQPRILRGFVRQFEPVVKRRCIHTPSLSQSIPRASSIRKELPSPPRWMPYAWPSPSRRAQSTLTAGSKERTAQETAEAEDRWANTPAYEMTFTCKQCNTRSSHKISKQGYHHGTVLIACPGCKNRHLIADHMKIFSDKSVTLEDIMKEKGQLVKRGTLSNEGDVEFWDDGTEVKRET